MVELLWRSCERRGVDRRTFFRFLAAGGAGAFFAACTAAPDASIEGDPVELPGNWFKDPSPFIVHGNRNLETRLSNLDTLMTPHELFFVRNNSRSIEIDAATWRLTVEGTGVGQPLELSYDDLRAMPHRSVPSYLECGGNHRAFFDLVMGRVASGTQWMTGGIGMAEWTGVPLLEVLERAEVGPEAVDVLFIGLDVESPEQGFRKAIPMDKAVDPDTLLAYEMNGVPLSPDHGFPVRTIVPGWVGSASIKWLGRIEVSTEKVWTRNNTTSYVLIGDDYPPEGEALGVLATVQSIKSAPGLAVAGGPRYRAPDDSRLRPVATRPDRVSGSGALTTAQRGRTRGCLTSERVTRGRVSSSTGTHRAAFTRSRLEPRTQPVMHSRTRSPSTRRATSSACRCRTPFRCREAGYRLEPSRAALRRGSRIDPAGGVVGRRGGVRRRQSTAVAARRGGLRPILHSVPRGAGRHRQPTHARRIVGVWDCGPAVPLQSRLHAVRRRGRV